jgi:hypothetical protein
MRRLLCTRSLVELALDVQQVVAGLVLGVDGNPPQGPLGLPGVAVQHGALPVGAAEPGQHVGEEAGRVAELAGDVGGVLRGVAVIVDPLVPAHRRDRRPFDPPGGDDPLALYEEDVPQMARVLQGRPNLRPGSPPQLVRANVGEHRGQPIRSLDYRRARYSASSSW